MSTSSGTSKSHGRSHSRSMSKFRDITTSVVDPSPMHTPSSSSSSKPWSLAYFLRPRKTGHRFTGLALLGLIILSTWIFFFAHPALTFSSSIALVSSNNNGRNGHGTSDAAREFLKKASSRGKKMTGSAVKPQVVLDASSELAAITSFIASLPQNSIPLSVDPSKPIDPELVLDFDTRSGARAAQNVVDLVEDVWASNPIVLYSKLYSPISREVKAILTNMHLRPSPTIVDVDMREDGEVLKPILARLTSSDLPILLIAGKPVGSIAAIRALDASGELRKLVREAGAVVDGAKKRKGKK